MKTKSWQVFGWLNGADYDAGKPADCVVKVRAANEGDADTKGDTKIAASVGRCDVVLSQLDE